MKHSFFLWPTPLIFNGLKNSLLKPQSEKIIERYLSDLFPGAYPVLTSSGRVGIRMLIKYLEYDRTNTIEYFPYASHCVLDAIARETNLVSSDTASQPTGRLIYHQWGYDYPINASNILIEDAVDSLYIPETLLFRAGSNYEIWSLPKILGTAGGGIVWCKKEVDAEALKILRDKCTGQTITFLLRLFGLKSTSIHSCWSGIEPSKGKVSFLLLGDISQKISQWNTIVEDRERKLELLSSFLPHWVSLSKGVLPCVIPLEVSNIQMNELKEMPFSTGIRNILYKEKSGKLSTRAVYPLPIHQDVPIEVIQSVVEILQR